MVDFLDDSVTVSVEYGGEHWVNASFASGVIRIRCEASICDSDPLCFDTEVSRTGSPNPKKDTAIP